MNLKKRYVFFGLVGPLASLMAWFFSGHAQLAESWYALGFYPVFSVIWGMITRWVPIPISELLIVLILVWLLFLVIRAIARLVCPSVVWPRRNFFRRLGRAAAKCAAIISLGIGIFLIFWGYNYQRQPWAVSHHWQADGGNQADLLALANRLAGDLAADRAHLPEALDGTALPLSGTWTDVAMLKRVNAAWDQAAAGDRLLIAHSGGAKASLVPSLWSSFGIAGIFIPFTGESLVNTGPQDFTIPFSAAHEIAHQRGWAREDEANFMAFLVLSATNQPDLRYSAHTMAFLYVLSDGLSNLPAADHQALMGLLPVGFLRDHQADARYWQRFQGSLAAAGSAINDSYLKSLGQSQGVRSYGRMVDLLLRWNKNQTKL